MSAIPKTLLSPDQYLAQERLAKFKSEYYRGEVFAMAGASYAHTLIKDSLARKAGNQLEDGPCRVLTSDIRVKVHATGLYTYPDIVVLCDPPEFEDDHFDTLLNPRIIVEVLSDSTEKYDRGDKFRQFRDIPSLKEYVLVSQNSALIERYVRQTNDDWLLTTFDNLSATFEFASVPGRIPLSEVYRGVSFQEDSGRRVS
jgi:Uma2 family endonuclease